MLLLHLLIGAERLQCHCAPRESKQLGLSGLAGVGVKLHLT